MLSWQLSLSPLNFDYTPWSTWLHRLMSHCHHTGSSSPPTHTFPLGLPQTEQGSSLHTLLMPLQWLRVKNMIIASDCPQKAVTITWINVRWTYRSLQDCGRSDSKGPGSSDRGWGMWPCLCRYTDPDWECKAAEEQNDSRQVTIQVSKRLNLPFILFLEERICVQHLCCSDPVTPCDLADPITSD